MRWYLEVLRKYAVFEGRAGRPEYWYFVLFNVVVGIVLGIADSALGTQSRNAYGRLGLLSGIYELAVLLPAIGVGIRRLHDIGRSGWWLLLGLIPILGWIVLLLFAIMESDGANKYGAAPAPAP